VTYLQVIAELDRSPFSELRSYTATDITPAFGPNLLQLVNNSKLEFKVHIADHAGFCQPCLSMHKFPLTQGLQGPFHSIWYILRCIADKVCGNADMGCQQGRP